MKKQQVDHVLRAAGRITGEKQFIITAASLCTESIPTSPMTSYDRLKSI
jgi:hypothetical protein